MQEHSHVISFDLKLKALKRNVGLYNFGVKKMEKYKIFGRRTKLELNVYYQDSMAKFNGREKDVRKSH